MLFLLLFTENFSPKKVHPQKIFPQNGGIKTKVHFKMGASISFILQNLEKEAAIPGGLGLLLVSFPSPAQCDWPIGKVPTVQVLLILYKGKGERRDIGAWRVRHFIGLTSLPPHMGNGGA